MSSLLTPICLGLYTLILGVPAYKLLRRAGYDGWMTVFALIPVVNVIALWGFAFARWPNRRRIH